MANAETAATASATGPGSIGRIIDNAITGIIRSCATLPADPGSIEPAITAPEATIPTIPALPPPAPL